MTIILVAAILSFEDTPDKTVRAFVDALNAKDAAGMSRRVVGQKPGKPPWVYGAMSLKASILKTTIEGDTAKVEVDAEIEANGQRMPKRRETVRLKRVGEDWQILPSDPNEPDQLQSQIIGSLAYMATNSDVFAQAKKAAKRTVCLSNVKQLALSTMLYSMDHNDILPKASAWKKAIAPYAKSERLFYCPEDTSGAVSYFLDSRVGGRSLTSIAFPAETAMVVEGTPKKTAFRHGGRASLGFTDGHAKSVDQKAMLKARTKPLK
ncbi:nuclear transport factor 2 family protein [bacterium]|nr:MAG: nuclear transport factor 2 family protein [bacterium]